jgi:hypothetical protein
LLLKEENFALVRERLGENGMRRGFVCLFYGPRVREKPRPSTRFAARPVGTL